MLQKLQIFLKEINCKLLIKYDGKRSKGKYSIKLLYRDLNKASLGRDTDAPCEVIKKIFKDQEFFSEDDALELLLMIFKWLIKNAMLMYGEACIISILLEEENGNVIHKYHVETQENIIRGTTLSVDEIFRSLFGEKCIEKNILPHGVSYQDIISINSWCQGITAHSVKPTKGIRDNNILKSIPESIWQSFAGEDLYPSIYDKCAYLWFSLSQYHCFADGNKRTALVTVLVYLIRNGNTLKIQQENLYNTCIGIADGNMKLSEIIIYLLMNTTTDSIYEMDDSQDIKNILDFLCKDSILCSILEKLGQ